MLLLGCERQRRPEPAIVQRHLRVGVIGDLDLDQLVDGIDVTACRFGTFAHRGQQLVDIEFLALARRADETVTGAPGVLGHHRTAGTDVHRHATLGNVVDAGSLEVVELAVEVHRLAAPQFTHQLDRLAQPGEALLELRPLGYRTGGNLVERLAGAHAEEHPARVQTAHGGECLGDHRRVVPKCRRQHRGAEHDPLGALADRRHPRQCERRVATLMAPRVEMIADRRAVHPVRLGEHTEFD